jgi:hypothetical protein
VARDQLQPAHGAFQKEARRGQHQRQAAVQRLQQAADQAHVVVQRCPGHEAVARADVHALLDGGLVGDEVAVADHHALGRRGGARGVLQEGDVVGSRRPGPPGVGIGQVHLVGGHGGNAGKARIGAGQSLHHFGSADHAGRVRVAHDAQQPLQCCTRSGGGTGTAITPA